MSKDIEPKHEEQRSDNPQSSHKNHEEPASNESESDVSQDSDATDGSDSSVCSDDGDEDCKKEKTKVNSHRKAYSIEFKKSVISYYIRFNFAMTVLKFSIPKGTLKSWIAKYNKEGDAFFIDERKFNGDKTLDEADVAISEYVRELGRLYLPATPEMIKNKARELVKTPDFQASDKWLSNF